MREKDAVIVGARCAGSTLAIALARQGWDVTLVDRDTFPSGTISTHLMYPNTLARLDQLGVLDTLFGAHRVPLLASRLIGLGEEVAGTYTPVGGFDRAAGPRRSALDKAIVDTALAAGAEGRFGQKVVELIGSGTEEDPVAGVVLDSGDEIHARWVFGADGRGSTVAGRLGVEKERLLQGETSFLFGYWTGISDDGYATLAIHEREFATRNAVEDGLHLMMAMGDAELTRGSQRERERRYVDVLRRFPEIIEPEELDAAKLMTEVIVAPESLMRGFFRRPTGPGWALIGDACHFKHPGTAQGICDAVEQAIYVADRLSSSDGNLDEYEAWRDDRAKEQYEWSFSWGRFPNPEAAPRLWKAWATEPDAGQDLRDTFTRLVQPSQLMSRERMGRWFAEDVAPDRVR
jgi:2-polyprenyl-6-methoxyphenol hydroxylase-like FAD-dependent oxidoreductase